MRILGDAAQWGVEQGKRVAAYLSKNGMGMSMMKASMEDVAASAAYNRLVQAAKPVISNMDADAAKEVMSAISKGEDFGTQAFNEVGRAMVNSGDEVKAAAAKNLEDMAEAFNTASSEHTVSAYAEFLGRENGKIGLANTLEGYFGDKRHGVKRIHTAVGAVAGVSVAGRLLSGGSLTRTNTGERDIAGVPFF